MIRFAALTTAARALVADRKGVTALEYGLIGALAAAAIVAFMGTFTGGLTNAFNDIAAALTNAI